MKRGTSPVTAVSFLDGLVCRCPKQSPSQMNLTSITRDAGASRINFDPSRTPAKNTFASNDDANWWMITLSSLTLLLLGFLIVWYLLGKNSLNATNLPAGSADIVQRPKSPSSSDRIHVDLRDWQTMGEEMRRFVAEIGLAKEVAI